MMARRGVLGAAVVLALALAGCGEETGPKVPKMVQSMMDAQFPADGQIHVQSRGKIVIEPDTPVCRLWEKDGDFGISSVTLFSALRQSYTGPDGSDRQYDAEQPVCRKSASVVTFGRRFENRYGEPYKLVLAIWQGDPARDGGVWVGGVERLDGRRPEITYAPTHSGGLFGGTSRKEAIRSASINADVNYLGNEFAYYAGETHD